MEFHPSTFKFNRQVDQVGRTKTINSVQSRAYTQSYSNTTLCGTRALHLGYFEFYSDYGGRESGYGGCGERSIESGAGERGPGQHPWPCLLTLSWST